MSQYEIWPAPTDKLGWDALVVYPDPDGSKPRKPLTTHFSKYFQSTRTLGEVRVEVGGARTISAQIILCQKMNRWPPPVPVVENQERPPK
jgi:hypothetical protein